MIHLQACWELILGPVQSAETASEQKRFRLFAGVNGVSCLCSITKVQQPAAKWIHFLEANVHAVRLSLDVGIERAQVITTYSSGEFNI